MDVLLIKSASPYHLNTEIHMTIHKVCVSCAVLKACGCAMLASTHVQSPTPLSNMRIYLTLDRLISSAQSVSARPPSVWLLSLLILAGTSLLLSANSFEPGVTRMTSCCAKNGHN